MRSGGVFVLFRLLGGFKGSFLEPDLEVGPAWEPPHKPGIGFCGHIAVSILCLVPYLKTESKSLLCLFLPTVYGAYVVGLWLRHRLRHMREASIITRVLRMERLVQEGSVPKWFPHFAALVYVIMVLQLELGHSFQSKSTRTTLLSASPQRHDYNCWGTDQEDVSDCVLVRHAGYTITVSFYICILALCSRAVRPHVGALYRPLQAFKSRFIDVTPYRLRSHRDGCLQ